MFENGEMFVRKLLKDAVLIDLPLEAGLGYHG